MFSSGDYRAPCQRACVYFRALAQTLPPCSAHGQRSVILPSLWETSAVVFILTLALLAVVIAILGSKPLEEIYLVSQLLPLFPTQIKKML